MAGPLSADMSTTWSRTDSLGWKDTQSNILTRQSRGLKLDSDIESINFQNQNWKYLKSTG